MRADAASTRSARSCRAVCSTRRLNPSKLTHPTEAMTQQSHSKAQLTLFGVFLLLLTAACTKEPTPPAATPQPPERQATPEPKGASDVQSPENPLLDIAARKWTGDLDGMIERRMVRVLTTHSKTTFFVDRGTQLGLVPDSFRCVRGRPEQATQQQEHSSARHVHSG